MREAMEAQAAAVRRAGVPARKVAARWAAMLARLRETRA